MIGSFLVVAMTDAAPGKEIRTVAYIKAIFLVPLHKL
jgi:hypothetical protein